MIPLSPFVLIGILYSTLSKLSPSMPEVDGVCSFFTRLLLPAEGGDSRLLGTDGLESEAFNDLRRGMFDPTLELPDEVELGSSTAGLLGTEGLISPRCKLDRGREVLTIVDETNPPPPLPALSSEVRDGNIGDEIEVCGCGGDDDDDDDPLACAGTVWIIGVWKADSVAAEAATVLFGLSSTNLPSKPARSMSLIHVGLVQQSSSDNASFDAARLATAFRWRTLSMESNTTKDEPSCSSSWMFELLWRLLLLPMSLELVDGVECSGIAMVLSVLALSVLALSVLALSVFSGESHLRLRKYYEDVVLSIERKLNYLERL